MFIVVGMVTVVVIVVITVHGLGSDVGSAWFLLVSNLNFAWAFTVRGLRGNKQKEELYYCPPLNYDDDDYYYY